MTKTVTKKTAAKEPETKEKIEKVPVKLYEFDPKPDIDTNNVVELARIVRVGIGDNVYALLSQELQKHFKEVA